MKNGINLSHDLSYTHWLFVAGVRPEHIVVLQHGIFYIDRMTCNVAIKWFDPLQDNFCCTAELSTGWLVIKVALKQ